MSTVDKSIHDADAAYHRLSHKMHPDAGGNTRDMQDLNVMHDATKKFKFDTAAPIRPQAEVRVDGVDGFDDRAPRAADSRTDSERITTARLQSIAHSKATNAPGAGFGF